MFPKILPPHPRLFASLDDWERIQNQILIDPVSARLWACLRLKAERFLSTSPIEPTRKGRRLLEQSRLCIERVVTLAAAARIGGDRRHAVRAIAEMRAVAAFADWNPSHFLDTAEMACALAIGLDWLYADLSREDRAAIATALRDKALLPSFESPSDWLWWVGGTNNWNQVCHGGMAVAAIAVAEIDPELSERTLERALANIPKAAHSYAPDGAYAEGPVYWDYGTLYHVIFAAALEHLIGDTCGLDRFPGFEASGEYLIEVTSPAGRFFNYSDSEEKRLFEVPLFWFARRFQRQDLLRHELEYLEAHLQAYEQNPTSDDSRFLALALLWHTPLLKPSPEQALPLNWLGRGVNPVAVFRSAWDDSEATFAGIKGGSPRDPHAHMDAGSFILEADGVRWAIDLDKEDYGSLESKGLGIWDVRQEGDRWKVFRFGAASHNILRFNRAEQQVDGRAEFIRFQPDGPLPHAVLDLDSIYRDQVGSALRGLAFFPDGSVLIQDEWLAGKREVKVEWQMLTRAEVIPGDGCLRLRQDGKEMTVRILSPDGVRVESIDLSLPVSPHDAPNPGLRQIRLRTSTRAGEGGRFRLLFISGSAAAPAEVPPLKPLDQWR